MTIEQVNEKFKDSKVTFESYYKYTFTFVGVSEDGYRLTCHYGGSSDDIYRYDVGNDFIPFNSTEDWTSIIIKNSKGEEVFNEYFDW